MPPVEPPMAAGAYLVLREVMLEGRREGAELLLVDDAEHLVALFDMSGEAGVDALLWSIGSIAACHRLRWLDLRPGADPVEYPASGALTFSRPYYPARDDALVARIIAAFPVVTVCGHVIWPPSTGIGCHVELAGPPLGPCLNPVPCAEHPA